MKTTFPGHLETTVLTSRGTEQHGVNMGNLVLAPDTSGGSVSWEDLAAPFQKWKGLARMARL